MAERRKCPLCGRPVRLTKKWLIGRHYEGEAPCELSGTAFFVGESVKAWLEEIAEREAREEKP